MDGLNKFKVLTVLVIGMFLFVVAAIYSNTREISHSKVQYEQQENIKKQPMEVSDNVNKSATSSQVDQLSSQLDFLTVRVDEISEKVDNINNQGLTCRVYGAITQNGVEQLTLEAAVEEAKVNNSDIVITCSY